MTEKLKIVFAPGSLPDDVDQEMIDAITAAITAQMNGEELPDGIEFNQVEELALTEEEIQQILDQHKELSEDELSSLEKAMREDDIDTFTEILTNAATRSVPN